VIVTFYSYKGGVGRSMAMANVARWYQLLGLNVVVIDWDLEAPGLESFFSGDPDTLAIWRSRIGLVDLMTLYRQDFPSLGLGEAALEDAKALRADVDRLHEVLAPLRFSLLDIPAPSAPADALPRVAPGKLRLLTAGWREGPERFAQYANAVQSFDWADFYASYRGQAYFEWLRESLCAPDVADIVLIDSRTGVTEMGGVCTRHLADVVTVLSAPNRQNIQGASMVARSFIGLSEQPWRGRRPMQVVMVPSRIDGSSHLVKSVFEPMFREHAAGLMPASLEKLKRDFWDLRIPYVDAYAFEEKMAVCEAGADPDLEAAYKLLAAHIGWLAAPESRVQQALRGEFDRVFGAELVRGQLDLGARFDAAWHRLPGAVQPAVRDLLLRLVQVGHTADDGDQPRSWRRADAEVGLADATAMALSTGLVKVERGTDDNERLVLAEADFVTRTALGLWIAEDRDRLLWRQRLRTYLDDWHRNPQDPGALLQGSVLDVAEIHARDGTPLLADEQAFIRRSRESAVAQAAAEAASAALARSPADAAATTAPSFGAAGLATPKNGASAAPVSRTATLWVAAGVLLGLVGLTAWWQLPTDAPVPATTTAGSAAAEPQLLEVRRLVDTGNPAGGLALLDSALRSRPGAHELLRARAVLRADTGDSSGALADLASLEQSTGALDVAGWSLRARMLAASGKDDPALTAYQRVLELGDLGAGHLGLAQIYERRGDKAGAVAAYRAAIGSTTDTRQRALAEARLQALEPEGTKVAAAPRASSQAFLQISLPADGPLAQPLGIALERAGVSVPKLKGGDYAWEVVPTGTARGDVRYFFREDQEAAQRARVAAQDALAAQGIDLTLALLYIDPAKVPVARRAQSGQLEVWLPPVAKLQGLRVQVFACGTGGPTAQALAIQAETYLQQRGAVVARRTTINETQRTSDFGLAPRGLEIRHSQNILPELLAARLMVGDRDFAALGKWRLVPTRTPTPGYLSLFICPASAGAGKAAR